MLRHLLALLSLLLAVPAVLHAADDAASRFDQALQPFLQTYCLRCHNAQQQEGEFRLDKLSRDFADQSAAESRKDGYQLRTVIENLVLSDLLQKR